jgi:type I restriction enzyme S subunit
MIKRVPVSALLFEYEERLGKSSEPVVLTLTEKNGFIPQEDRFKKRLATADTTNYKVVRRFDIAYNQYLLWAGAIAQNKNWEAGIVSPAYPTFRVRQGFDPRYVDWLLAGDPIRLRYDAISFGAVPRRRRAKVSDFLAIDIPEPPPLAEQKRIAAILDAADALRAKRRESLAQLDTLLQSTFLEMFGDPVTNPKGWEELSISELCDSPEDVRCGPFGTQLQQHEFTTSGVPLWGIKHVNTGFSFTTNEFISEEKARQLNAYRIMPGDLVMTRKGTIGNCCIYPDHLSSGVMHSDLLRLRISEKRANNQFISFQFAYSRKIQRQLELMSPGAVMPGINVSKLKKLNIECPPLDLQQRFATIVESIERQKTRLRAHLAELDGLFASLQSRAFNGQL